MKKIILLAILLVACDAGDHKQQPLVKESNLPSTNNSEVPTASIQSVEEDPGSLQNTYAIMLDDYRDDCWHLAQVNTGAAIMTISNSSITCFESHQKEDVSPNGQVSLLHTLARGELDNGSELTLIEKYACYFIDLGTGELSDAYTDSMCSGAWSADSSWVVDEDEVYSIAELL